MSGGALNADELAAIGFAAVGRDVKISRRAAFYGASRIVIGDHTRIDDFCVFSAGDGGILVGNNVHIAVMCTLIGKGAINIGDLSTLSGRVSVYSSSDDYSGRSMTNPTVPKALTDVDHQPVSIGRHVIVGCGSVVLPGTVIEDGVAIGALSLAKGRLQAFSIYAGSPVRRIRERERRFLDLEAQMRHDDGA